MSALCGRTIVVTRPRTDGERMAARLVERGAKPVLFPTIDVRPLDDPRALDEELLRLRTFDWVIFTSAHAVEHTWARANALGISFPTATRIAAIGPATREALNARGVSTCVVPQVYRGTALPGALRDVQGCRMLLPRSDIGRDEAAEGLRHAGATVVAVTAYRTLPAAPDEEGLARLRLGVDAVLFTSPSTVQNFERLLRSETIAVLSRAAVVCIGPTTADAARAIGVEALVSPTHTTDGMIAVLEEHFGRLEVLATTREGA